MSNCIRYLGLDLHYETITTAMVEVGGRVHNRPDDCPVQTGMPGGVARASQILRVTDADGVSRLLPEIGSSTSYGCAFAE